MRAGRVDAGRIRTPQEKAFQRRHLPRRDLRGLGLSRFPLLAVLFMGVLRGEVQHVRCLGLLLELGQSVDKVPGVLRGQFAIVAPLQR